MTGTHTLNCDSRLGYQCTCTLQPEPDAGEEWRVFEFQRLRVLNKTGRLVADAQTEAEAAQIVSDHNAIPKIVAALEAAQKYISAGYQPPELMDQIDTALALVKGRRR